VTFNLKKKSIEEINRIRALGWEDSLPDENGVRVFSLVDENAISFPSEKYEVDTNSSESAGIWSEIRARKIAALLQNRDIDLVWEIGAGHGNMAIQLAEQGIATIPIEPLYSGARALSSKGFHSYAQTLDQLNLPDDCLGAVGIFDVLEHLPNPETVLREIYRVLKPGGVLLTSVPAYQWLFSDFDIRIGHFRRYSRKSLFNLLSSSNFKETKISNLFFIFIAPAFILRRLPFLMGIRRKKKETIPTSENYLIRLLTPILRILLLAEMRMRIPLGLSIFSESVK
jgi:2-polyprenyl-3-methyl-5-hydroxy-6-metoxy-1,4-benzoquinol methylase